MPPDLLPSEVRSKYQVKPSDRSKRAKKEETKSSANQAEENQVPIKSNKLALFLFVVRLLILIKGLCVNEIDIQFLLYPMLCVHF